MVAINVFDAQPEYDSSDPRGYRSGVAAVGRAAGGMTNNVKVYELPTDQSVSPYHYEYEEEWLLVLEGTVVLRDPDGEHPLGPGDLVCFPSGPEGAHKVSNPGEASARVMMFSSAREPAVAVYPDSDKIGVWPGRGSDTVMVKRADGAVDYWEGER